MPAISTSVGKLVYLESELIQAVDMGLHVPFEEMKRAMQENRTFELLDDHKDKLDLSLLNDEDKDYIGKNLADIAEAYSGRERRKFGVEGRGELLLLAYVLELIGRSASHYHVTWDVRES